MCLRAAFEDWPDDPSEYIITSYKAEVISRYYLSFSFKSQAIKTIVVVREE